MSSKEEPTSVERDEQTENQHLAAGGVVSPGIVWLCDYDPGKELVLLPKSASVYPRFSPDDIWRVEATFTHIGKAIYATGAIPEPKRDAYRQVSNWLMSEGIERVLVYKNGELHQEIEVKIS